MKIVMLDRSGMDFAAEKRAFQNENASFYVSYLQNAEDLRRIIRDADILLCRDMPVTADIIRVTERCRLIMRYGSDCSNIDIKAAGKHGIYVSCAPDHAVTDIAEYTMALLLSLLRKIPEADRLVKMGNPDPDITIFPCRLRGKTLGLYGFGKVARSVAARARAFETDILYFDPFISMEDAILGGGERVDADTLLKNADFLSVHLPLTDDTYHLFGMEEFSKMKKSAVLINTASGGLIDENELAYALLSGTIAGAALDVFEGTAPSPRLLTLNNVILSPRFAASSAEAEADLKEAVIQNVLRVIRGKIPENIMNEAYFVPRYTR